MNNWENYGYRINGGMSKAVKWLLIGNIAVFVLQQLFGYPLTAYFGLSLRDIQHGLYWQFITYMFLHANFIHIFFNMFMLFAMGPETERGLGTRNFLIVYLGSGLLGGVMWVLLGYQQVCVGASGAIYGVLGAYAALWPNRLLVFMFIPYPIKAWKLVCGFAVLEFVLSLAPATGGGVAHLVHLVGLGVGVGVTYVYVHRKMGGRGGGPKLRVIQGGGVSTKVEPGEAPIDPEMVDCLLDKIANQGMGSLSKRERAVLEAASRQRKKSR